MEFITIYTLYNSIFLLDLWDILLRHYLRMKYTGPREKVGKLPRAFPTSIHLGLPYMSNEEKKRRLKPVAIVVSIFNAEGYIAEFLDNLKPYLDKLLIVDDCSTDGTRRILEQYGVRYLRNETNMKKPASIKRAVDALPEEIETVIVMDPDARFIESGLKSGITDMEEVLSDFQRSGADGCAMRIKVREINSAIVKLQELEYRICLSLGKKTLLNKTILSGVAIYKRKSLKDALERHTLSIYAEDMVTSLLILNAGGVIYYDGRLQVETDGKPDLKGLISQRVGWDFGYIMGYIRVLRRMLRGEDKRPLFVHDRRFPIIYNYAIYLGLFGILFHPLKLFSLTFLLLSFTNLISLLFGLPLPFKDTARFTPMWSILFYGQYTMLTIFLVGLTVEDERRKRYVGIIPLYPFYALFLMLVRTIGFVNYLAALISGRKVYNDHYEDRTKRYKGLLG